MFSSRCRSSKITRQPARLAVVSFSSGYYIFNEPLKQAAIEVRAKEAKERAAAGGGSGSSSSDLGGGGDGSGR